MPDPFANYDAWLEAPYQRMYAQEPPGEIQDMMDVEFWLEGERAVVDSYEEWSDADEDGVHGGIDFVVRVGGVRDERYHFWKGGRTQNMSPADLEEILAKQDEHRPEPEQLRLPL